MTLIRAASHIKVIYMPTLIPAAAMGNVKRSITLHNCTYLRKTIKLCNFADAEMCPLFISRRKLFGIYNQHTTEKFLHIYCID